MSKSSAAHLRLSLPDELYVGAQGQFSTTDFPLGFATPNGTDSAALKRIETVDNWKGKNNPSMVISNMPVEGFTFDRSVTRWRTSNKWFRIQDPRGFTLEISAENLGDVLLHGEISAGMLQRDYVWAREGGKNYLLSTDHPDYIALKAPPTNRQLQVLDMIESKSLQKVQYLGRFHVWMKMKHTEYYDEQKREWSTSRRFSSWYLGSGYNKQQEREVITEQRKHLHVFLQQYKNGKDGTFTRYLQTSTSLPKQFAFINDTPYVTPDEYTNLGMMNMTMYGSFGYGCIEKEFFATKASMDAEHPLTK